MSNTSAANTSATAVGMTMGAVPVRERVFGTDGQPPFPLELMEGFPGKSKAPTAALMVSATATAVVIGVLLAVALGREKRVETRWLDSLMGWEQCLVWKELFVAFCWFLLVGLEHWVAVLCVELMMVHLLHF